MYITEKAKEFVNIEKEILLIRNAFGSYLQ